MLLDIYNLSSFVSGAAAGTTGQPLNPVDWWLFGANVFLGVATLCVAFNYLFAGILKCRIKVSVPGLDKTFFSASSGEHLCGDTSSFFASTVGGGNTGNLGTGGGTGSPDISVSTSSHKTCSKTREYDVDYYHIKICNNSCSHTLKNYAVFLMSKDNNNLAVPIQLAWVPRYKDVTPRRQCDVARHSFRVVDFGYVCLKGNSDFIAVQRIVSTILKFRCLTNQR